MLQWNIFQDFSRYFYLYVVKITMNFPWQGYIKTEKHNNLLLGKRGKGKSYESYDVFKIISHQTPGGYQEIS